jgi:hypothetical protein
MINRTTENDEHLDKAGRHKPHWHLFAFFTKLRYALVVIMMLQFLWSGAQNQNPSRVLLQSFWWDYWNSNFPNGYFNYLTELAPRLREIGVDAVWIPPSTKGGSGTSDVGYGVFDHYDLGDKFQQGDVPARSGARAIPPLGACCDAPSHR